jgi:HD superfamily phosphohydrolase YqeK
MNDTSKLKAFDPEAILREFHVPEHVRRHCEVVTKFAVELGEKLISAGHEIDLELLGNAAAVHDFMRVVDFRVFHPENFPQKPSEVDISFWKILREKYAGRRHEEVAAEILVGRGFVHIAKIIAAHRFKQIEKGFDSWEEKLLYYADKRTAHNEIVSLEERLSEGRNRNAPETIGTDSAKQIDEKIFALEKEILAAAESK